MPGLDVLADEQGFSMGIYRADGIDQLENAELTVHEIVVAARHLGIEQPRQAKRAIRDAYERANLLAAALDDHGLAHVCREKEAVDDGVETHTPAITINVCTTYNEGADLSLKRPTWCSARSFEAP